MSLVSFGLFVRKTISIKILPGNCENVMSPIFDRQSISYCKACDQNYNCSPSQHLILNCHRNENIRTKLCETLNERFGNTFYRWCISLSPFVDL